MCVCVSVCVRTHTARGSKEMWHINLSMEVKNMIFFFCEEGRVLADSEGEVSAT